MEAERFGTIYGFQCCPAVGYHAETADGVPWDFAVWFSSLLRGLGNVGLAGAGEPVGVCLRNEGVPEW